MAVIETVSLMLTGTDTFISSTGKKFIKGEIYSVSKEEAIKLMSVKGDYDVRFFKKHEGEEGVKAAPVDITKADVLPSQEAIAADMKKDAEAINAKAMAEHKADMAATSSRGTEPATEEVVAPAATGETDTATAPTGKRGRPAAGGVAV